MQEYTLTPTNDQPAVRFTGELLGEVNSRRTSSLRWTVLRAYRTKAGKMIVEQVGETTQEGERQYVDVYVFGSIEEMTAKMGYGRLSVALYQKLGIDTVTID